MKQKGEMKEMHKKNKLKAVLAFIVALAFILPGSSAFANFEETTTENNDINVEKIDIVSQILELLDLSPFLHFGHFRKI